MKVTKTPNRLILCAALLSVPVIIASWWMLKDERTDSGAAGKEWPEQSNAPQTGGGNGPRYAGSARSQGESAEIQKFQEYAAGLRKQGLRTETVRELVASRITAAYETKRAELRSSAGNAEGGAIRGQIEHLNHEQGALIQRLVGAAEPPVNAVPVQEPPNGMFGELIEKTPIMPAVMASTPPAGVQTDAQLAEWEKSRDNFVQAIGGTDQNPADPGYRRKWIQAQSEADQQFRLWYGDSAYVAHQMQAQREAQLQQGTQTQR